MERLMGELNKLPTIGPKTAQRLAFHILNTPSNEVKKLASALLEVKEKIKYCSICYNITEETQCSICRDSTRDRGVICVVEKPSDVMIIEKMREYKGLYHVLLGTISPLEGVGPEDLKVKELLNRLNNEPIREVILATNASVEGEATALYLTKLIKPFGITITRIARGIPVGGNLEYADEITLAKALEGRREVF
jgi:recombination protein RecR